MKEIWKTKKTQYIQPITQSAYQTTILLLYSAVNRRTKITQVFSARAIHEAHADVRPRIRFRHLRLKPR